MLNDDSRNKNLKNLGIRIFHSYSDRNNFDKNDGFQVVSQINICSASYVACNKHNGTGNNSKLSIRKQNII